MRRPEPRGTLPIRFRADERLRIEAAAVERGEYVTSYIRRVALEAARRDLSRPPERT